MNNDTMPPLVLDRLHELLSEPSESLLTHWLEAQKRARSAWRVREGEGEQRRQSAEFLRLLSNAIQTSMPPGAPFPNTITGSAWDNIREALDKISRFQASQGFAMSDLASFILTLKQALYTAFRKSGAGDTASQILFDLLPVMALLDALALFSMEMFQRSRDAIILRQQQELLELSTPVVSLWDGILALPLIGTLDSARSQVVMESLLEAITDSGSRIAIIDITGVPTVDTLVSQHLLKTVAAARLMGAECIISGIRPQIAQTIVHLGVDLSTVITKASLAEAFRLAMAKVGPRGGQPSLQAAKLYQ